MDWLAVYHREAEDDADAAIAVGEHAIVLADRAGRPDREEYAIYLGNYSMALREARRLAEAVDVMDRSLEVTRDSVGIEHEEYAGSLSIKGNILEAWKRFTEAGEAHQQAVMIIRKVMDRRAEREVRQALLEILNDYAAYLLRDKPEQPENALSQALALLDGALTHVARRLRLAAGGDEPRQGATAHRAIDCRRRGLPGSGGLLRGRLRRPFLRALGRAARPCRRPEGTAKSRVRRGLPTRARGRR